MNAVMTMLAVNWQQIGTIALLVGVIVLFYFLMIRPQKKREKEANDMRDNLRVGDEVSTIGGIVGKIVSLRDETVVIETTKDKTHIRFLRAAIRSVDVRAEDSVDPTKKEPAEKPAGGKKGKKKKAAIEKEAVKDVVETAETPAETVIEETKAEEVAAEVPATEAEAPAEETTENN